MEKWCATKNLSPVAHQLIERRDTHQKKLECHSHIAIMQSTSTHVDNASVMELVDMTDSKSVASDSVAVQVRPLVPSLLFEVDTETDL